MIAATKYHKSVKLTADQIAFTYAVCPLCGGSAFSAVYPLQTDPAVTLMRCPGCDAVFADKVPSESFLSAYYSSYYADNHSGNTCASSDRFTRRMYRELKIGNPHSYRILDFGGGNGSLSLSLAKRIVKEKGCSVSIVVVDYYPGTVKSPDPDIAIEHCRTLDAVTGSFDAVIASSVLDHLPQPKLVMKRLAGMLVSGGFFYARTSYVFPLMRVFAFFGIKMDFTYPGHLYDFGQTFWTTVPEKVFTDGSMTPVFSRPSPVETSLYAAPLRTLVAHLFKALWYLTFGKWPFVGGWEAGFVKK